MDHGDKYNVTFSGYMVRWQLTMMYNEFIQYKQGNNYINRVVKLRNMKPPRDVVISEYWPWRIKIYTLGRFSLLLNNQNIDTGSRPFDILKFLLAYGGRDVHVEKIMDALWPEAEGDQAQASFKTTLHRLRKLLGETDALNLKNHRLSLNDEYVWVDSWAMSSIFTEFEHIDPIHTSELANKLLQYYRGHFLEDETASWTIYQREGLRSQFVRCISNYAKLLEAIDVDTAIKCYQRLLEIDPLIEIAYQGLIRCYLAQNRQAEAHSVYQQCVDVLKTTSNLKPSKETTSLLQL